MAFGIRSHNHIHSAANPVPIPAPAGITVGDLLIVMCTSDVAVLTTGPTDFTLLTNGGEATHQASIWSKTAVSADTSATYFNIPNTGTKHVSAVMWVIQSPGTVEHYGLNGKNGSGNISTGFDPAATGDILLAVGEITDGTTHTIATTNNNPSWTEDWSSTSWWHYTGQSAVYGSDAATGNITFVVSLGDWSAAVCAIAPPAAAPSTPIHLLRPQIIPAQIGGL